MKLLILEDDEIIARQLKSAFESFYSISFVDYAKTIEQAKFYLAETIYDVISLDFHLPDGNGMALAKEIRVNGENKETPIFMITAESSIHLAFEAYDQIRCFKFICKPFSQVELEAAIKLFKETQVLHSKTVYFNYQSRTMHLRIPMHQILYIETSYKQTELITYNRRFVLGRIALSKLLSDYLMLGFVQVHRSYIVKISKIERMIFENKGWFLEVKGLEKLLPIGSMFLSEVKNILAEDK